MAHEHINFEDARRFGRLGMGIVSSDDADWVVEFAAKVRVCRTCAEVATRANTLMFGNQYDDRADPTIFGEECVSVDDLMMGDDDPKVLAHLRSCAACQLRYQEAAAISDVAVRMHAGAAETFATAADVSRTNHTASATELPSLVLRAAIRIAESWAAILRGPELATGLLGPGDEEWLSEAVVQAGQPLEHARLEIDHGARVLIVSNLPKSCPPDRLEAHLGDVALRRVGAGQREARFDLAPVWRTGDQTLTMHIPEL